MRERFNLASLFERCMDDDDEGVHIGAIEDVGPPPSSQKYNGTRSQIVTYEDRWDQTIAIVHQYGHRNGEPAKGSRPDPKYLYETGTRYRYDASLD